MLPINVVDSHGRQIDPLDSQRWRARAGRVDLAFSGFDKFNAGRVLILIDLSGSLKDEADVIKHVGPALARNLPAGARVAFGFFYDKVVMSSGFTSDPKELEPLIDQARKTRMEGRTSLLDAIHQGLQLFHDPVPGDAIVVITDGDDNASKIKRQNAERELQAAGVRLFPLVLIHRSSLFQYEEGREWLVHASRDTGGATYDISTDATRWADAQWKKDLNNSLLTFWQETVLHGYSIRLKIPAEIRKPSKWKLEAVATDDKRMREAEIYYPRYLEPCGSTGPATPNDKAEVKSKP